VGDTDGIVRVEVGLNPQGIVLNSEGTRAYVENFISRDVSAVDISSPTPLEIARIASATLPPVLACSQSFPLRSPATEISKYGQCFEVFPKLHIS
jgi:DNA-binding beta-propeller fold protein YncE